jgi:DNA-binding ferritin-like protein (Dps family)
MASKAMCPGKPERVKSRRLLILKFASFFIIRELSECGDFELAGNPLGMFDYAKKKITLPDEEDQRTFSKELRYLAKKYTETLTADEYKYFLAVMRGVSEEFERVYKIISEYIMSGALSDEKSLSPEKNAADSFNAGINRILTDLLFNLAAGGSVRSDWSYEDQLGYFRKKVLPDGADLAELIDYGQKNNITSKVMYPGKPEKVKNRRLLIFKFASYFMLRELSECGEFELAGNPLDMFDYAKKKITLPDEEDQRNFSRELRHLANSYAETLTEGEYKSFLAIMRGVSEEFDKIYRIIAEYVGANAAADEKDLFSVLQDIYGIPESEAGRFHLEVDAIAETTIVKRDSYVYMDEIKSEWEKHMQKYRFRDELADYIKKEKSICAALYGNPISSMRNEQALFTVLADVTVKLVLADGANDAGELTAKTDFMTSGLSGDIRGIFGEKRSAVIKRYRLSGGDYPSDIGRVLIPYRADLIYLRDIITEEIDRRNTGNIVHKQNKTHRGQDEYELLISQRDAEIYELRRELEYYENVEQQEFKAEVSQYNKALADLFRKLCDSKYNSPLNRLYLMANNSDKINAADIKSAVQNMIFILGSMSIVPYDTGNIGKKVKFYDDEANIVYAVDESSVKSGLNQGVLAYPGWKYKDIEMVLPTVNIQEE